MAVDAIIYLAKIRGSTMRQCFLILASVILVFPYYAISDVNFKAQTIKDTLSQAKTEQKLIFSVCSSTECPPCNWMKANVYSDPGLANIINNKLIPIKPQASMDRGEYYKNCKMLPTMIFLDHNGKTIHKVEGRQTLEEMKKIVDQVLSSSCTGEDEKLDEASDTHKGNVCCEGLVKETKNNERVCVKQYCVENSDLGIEFEGDGRNALACCDDSARRRIISQVTKFKVHCIPRATPNEIDNDRRYKPKVDFPADIKYKKKNSDSKTISY